MWKRLIIGIAALTLIVSGCSFSTKSTNNEPSNSDEKINQDSEIEDFVAAEDVEGMIKEGPGIFAGDSYDQKKVEKELDKFPEDITAEEAYNRLIYLLAEDYEQLVDESKNLDISYTLDRELPSGVEGEKGESQINIAILLDASGSMNDRVSGGIKMDLAKRAIKDFASNLPESANVSLRVFGHKEGKSKKESCQSSEIVYPLSPYDSSDFQSALNKFGAQGWTPLAKGIRDARKDLQEHAGEGVQNIVYVVSDGEETCGGDPVKEAKELHNSDMKAIINVIGFDVSNREQRALKEVAREGGGSYKSANSAKELEDQLHKERLRLHEELNLWSQLTLEDLNKRKDELLKQNGKIRTLLNEMKNRERSRLLDAERYLSSRGIHPEGLSNKLSTRYNEIHNYIVTLNKDTGNRILQSHIEAIREMRKKGSDVLNGE